MAQTQTHRGTERHPMYHLAAAVLSLALITTGCAEMQADPEAPWAKVPETGRSQQGLLAPTYSCINNTLVQHTFARGTPKVGATNSVPDTTIEAEVIRLLTTGSPTGASIRMGLFNMSSGPMADAMNTAAANKDILVKINGRYEKDGKQKGGIKINSAAYKKLIGAKHDQPFKSRIKHCNNSYRKGCISNQDIDHAKYITFSQAYSPAVTVGTCTGGGLHNKVVWIGSANFVTGNGGQTASNNATIVYGDSALYDKLIEAWTDAGGAGTADYYKSGTGEKGWAYTTHPTAPTKVGDLHMSPEPTEILWHSRLSEFYSGTGAPGTCSGSVRILAASFRDNPYLVNKLREIQSAGCNVYISYHDMYSLPYSCLTKPNIPNAKCGSLTLTGAAIPSGNLVAKLHVHDKFFIAEDTSATPRKLVVTGSTNWGSTSGSKTQDIIFNIKDPSDTTYNAFKAHFDAVNGTYTAQAAYTLLGEDSYWDQLEVEDEGVVVAADNTPPTVSFTAPTGTVVGRVITMTTSASDDVGVSRVDFFSNAGGSAPDVFIGAAHSPPYTLVWDSQVPQGSGTNMSLIARAYDFYGNSGFAVKSVYQDVNPPSCKMIVAKGRIPRDTVDTQLFPVPQGRPSRGSANLRVHMKDDTLSGQLNGGIDFFRSALGGGTANIKIGNLLGTQTECFTPDCHLYWGDFRYGVWGGARWVYNFDWNIKNIADGQYTMQAGCYDGYLNASSSATGTVTVDNSRDKNDINGDGKADLLLWGGSGWTTIPIALSQGTGSFTVVNLANAPLTNAVAAGGRLALGDMDGDRDTDIVVTGIPGRDDVVIGFSNRDGTFTVVEVPNPTISDYVRRQTLRLADVDGDGRSDVFAKITAGLSLGDGKFRLPTNPLWEQAVMAAPGAVRHILAGDYNEDAFADELCIGTNCHKSMLYGTMSSGDGNSSIDSFLYYRSDAPNAADVATFVSWASTANVQAASGDFNGDGRWDVALAGGSGWTTIPVAFVTRPGGIAAENRPISLQIYNKPVTTFPALASATGAQLVSGDYNGDGLDDLALVGGVSWSTIPVAFSNGDGSFTVSNNTNSTWANLAQQVGAKAGDDSSVDSVGLTLATGQLPAPTFGATLVSGSSVSLNANTTTLPGKTVSKVDFYDGATLLSSDTTPSYSYNWTASGLGKHTLSAKMTDSKGLVTSTTIDVIVAPSVSSAVLWNATGSVSTQTAIYNPLNGGASVSAVAYPSMNIQAITNVTAGSVAFHLDGSSLPYRVENATPYALCGQTGGAYATCGSGTDSANPMSNGTHTLKLVAWTGANASGYPGPEFLVSYTVDSTGSIALTNPGAALTMAVSSPLNLQASALAPAGTTISKVEFFADTTLLGTDTTSPYAYNWTPSVAGAYSVTAKMTLNTAATVTSAAVVVTAGPTVGNFYLMQVTGTTTQVELANLTTGTGIGNTWSQVQYPATTVTATSSNAGSLAFHYGTETNPFFVDNSSYFAICGDNANVLLACSNTPPAPMSPGTHTIRAVPWSGANVTGTKGIEKSVTYTIDSAGWVSLDSPIAGSSYGQGSVVGLAATAIPFTGKTVSRVDFYDGATLLGSDSVSPYTYDWTASTGQHVLSARLVDNTNFVLTSSTVTMSVAPAISQVKLWSATGNAGTQAVLQNPLVDGTRWLPSGAYSTTTIEAVPAFSVGSIAFYLEGETTPYAIRNSAPYMLCGSTSGVHQACPAAAAQDPMSVRPHVIKIVAWSGANATGSAAPARLVTYGIVNANVIPDPSAEGGSLPSGYWLTSSTLSVVPLATAPDGKYVYKLSGIASGASSTHDNAKSIKTVVAGEVLALSGYFAAANSTAVGKTLTIGLKNKAVASYPVTWLCQASVVLSNTFQYVSVPSCSMPTTGMEVVVRTILTNDAGAEYYWDNLRLTTSATVATPGNGLTNPSFEGTTTGWSTSTAAVLTSVIQPNSPRGASVGVLTSNYNATVSFWLTNYLVTSPAQHSGMSAGASVTAGSASAVGKVVTLYVYEHDASNAIIGSCSSSVTLTDHFRRIQIPFCRVTGAGSKHSMQFDFQNSLVGETLLVDDVYLQKGMD